MRQLFLAVLLAPIAACAVVPQKPDTPLYETYRHYREAVADGSVVVRRDEFFTSSVLDEIDSTSAKDIKALRIGASVADERSHYEKMEKERGCLTVNGYGDNGDPVSLFIEYRSVNNKWLTSHTNIYIPGKEVFNGFFEKPLCPEEAQEEVMREFEQGK
jgi:hypothetical protein